jgi:hypothetical protein
MQLYFIDDSGTISSPNKIIQTHFVLGGLVIPEGQWHSLEREFFEIRKAFNVDGEIKWRLFGQRRGREEKENPLSHLSIAERDELRNTLLMALADHKSIKLIVGVIHLPSIYSSLQTKTPEYVHDLAYKSLITTYQSYLYQLSQITNSTVNGIIISDHRNPTQDVALRNLHMDILKSEDMEPPKFPNLIESLFLAPSHHSIGIQFADLISGAVFRYFEHKDDRWFRLLKHNFWKSPIEQEDAFVMMGDWNENGAESMEPLDSTEPALMTQSQRTPDHISE